jgi:cysteinyl-tRNA synthetase
MQLKLHNTLSGKKEIFQPIDHSNITMYVCGPTVYARAHLGNARSIIVYDILYRILQKIYPKVTYLRNITDVDDKIIKAAFDEKTTTTKISDRYTKFFHEDMKYLSCLNPTFEPKATNYIKDMIEIIEQLIHQKKAYIKNGSVYFDVSEFPNYGKLSKRKLDEQIDCARIKENEDKDNAEDFVLWKVEPTETDAIFESPWGPGRPGWHIECSAMTFANFGHTFDIHGGGSDLKFPHHENEIAQICAAHKDAHYAKYWVHNGFLTVDGQKMSKSLENFITVEDIRKKNLDGEIARYTMLRTHYTQPFDWSEQNILETKKDLKKLCDILINFPELENREAEENLHEKFFENLLDDMNTPIALMSLQTLANQIHSENDEKVRKNLALKIYSCLKFIGIDPFILIKKYGSKVDENTIQKLIKERKIAKNEKNFSKSDEIRVELTKLGIEVKDVKNNEMTWSRVVNFD